MDKRLMNRKYTQQNKLIFTVPFKCVADDIIIIFFIFCE